MARRPPRTASFPLLLLAAALLPASSFATELFWNDADVSDRRVKRCDVASCTPSDFEAAVDPGLSGDLAIDPLERMVYWAVAGSLANTMTIQRKSLLGGAVEDMFDIANNSVLLGMAVDPVARHVYVSVSGGAGRILRFSMDDPGGPSTAAVLFNEVGCSGCVPEGLALDLDAGFLYWADPINGKVARRTLGLVDPIEDVVTGLVQPKGLALDVANDRIYFSDQNTAWIRYALLSSPTTITPVIEVGGLGCAGCLEVDSKPGNPGRLIVSLPGAGEIRSCSLAAGCPSLIFLVGDVDNGAGLALLGTPAVPALGTGAGALATALLGVAGGLALWRRGHGKPLRSRQR